MVKTRTVTMKLPCKLRNVIQAAQYSHTQTVGQGAGWSQISETKTTINDKFSRLHNGWGWSGGVWPVAG